LKLLAKTLLLILIFTSCEDAEKSREELLPASSGLLGELVVISDVKSLDSNYKVLIKSVFGEKLAGFPPPGEASFKVLFTDETYFRGYFKAHHNVFVLLTSDNLDRMTATFGESNKTKVKDIIASEGALGWKQKNLWAKSQNVFYVTASSTEAMKTKLQNRKQDLLDIAFEHEVQTGSKKLYVKPSNSDSFYHSSLRTKGYGLRKPNSYRVAINEPHFAWLRKSPANKEQEFGVLMFDVPYVSEDQLDTDKLIEIRNSFTKKHIPGEYDGSYMKYSDVFTPDRRDINFKKRFCADIRGWWDMEVDFMGGPSIIKAVVDEENRRIIFVEGFLFYPNEKKSIALRELDLILNSLAIK
jgi:hypothetical protein